MQYIYDYVFIVEEESMKLFLQGLLPRIISTDKKFDIFVPKPAGKAGLLSTTKKKKTVTGKKKQDNLQSLMAAYLNRARTVIALIDRDCDDCVMLKQKMLSLMYSNNSTSNTENHIIAGVVCSELEAWYFGDVATLQQYSGKPTFNTQSTYRDFVNSPDVPDKNNKGKPSEKMQRLMSKKADSATPGMNAYMGKLKAEWAEHMGRHISIDSNKNPSFNWFIAKCK